MIERVQQAIEKSTHRQQRLPRCEHWGVHIQVEAVLTEMQPLIVFPRA